jgi:hypothetical protein
MQVPLSKVHLVVAPNYSERLAGLPPGEPAWVADTTRNKPVIQSIWSQKREGITSFRVAPGATPEDWLLSVLGEIELHHGEYSQSPPYSALNIIGTSLSQRLQIELESYGFKSFKNTTEGFLAEKIAA